MSDPQLLNKKQLANYLGVSTETIDRMEKNKKLPERVFGTFWSKRVLDHHLVRPPEPRMMNMKMLAAYLGVSGVTISTWMKSGILPPRVTGTSYWDRKAVDAHLDRISGLAIEDEAKSDYERWRERNHHERSHDERHQADQGHQA